LPRKRKFENPFSRDYAHAVSVCNNWRYELSIWIARLRSASSELEASDLRLAAFLISSIVYGQIFGAPYLVALVRAIPERKRRTFVIGRVHVELSLSRKGVADAEHRIWLPDPLTATHWSKLEPADARELLAPAVREGQPYAASDGTVLKRIGKLINGFRSGHAGRRLTGIEELRLCTREVALGECMSTFVAYNNAEFSSESLRRCDVARLFPGQPFLEFESPAEVVTNLECAGDTAGTPSEPDWLDLLLGAAQSGSAESRLSMIAADTNKPASARLVADFGVAMASRTSRPGNRFSARKVASTVILIGRTLGNILDNQDLATMAPDQRMSVYLDVINQQAARVRPDMVQAIREFDLHLVAINTATLPVQRNSLPWFPEPSSVDPNLITPREYRDILDRIEAEWPARSGERRRKMARLLVVLSFRCGLRRGELRGVRMEDVLILGRRSLHVRHRKDDPLKTPNAMRRIPLEVLLPPDECEELRGWLKRRAQEGAKAADHLFATPGGRRIPNSLFDDLNAFLRNATRYANGGKGIHLHHCRHAFGAWMFVSLVIPDSGREALFPTLNDKCSWLPARESLRRCLYGHTNPSKKDPYQIARLCGHASFESTTASSYIHLFPWLVAHELDNIESLKPDPELVLRSSKAPREESKKWLRNGGAHNIPMQLLLVQGAHQRTGIPTESIIKSESRAQANPEEDWLVTAWNQTVRHALGELVADDTPEVRAMFERADWLSERKNSAGQPQHPMESKTQDVENSKSSSTIAAPLKPPHTRNRVSRTLKDAISRTASENTDLLKDAVGIFAQCHERDGFVKFKDVSDVHDADRYIEFLRKLDFGKRELDLVSGDSKLSSELRRQWRDTLSETYLDIRPCPPGRNYTPVMSLWIRPKSRALGRRNTGPAGFRFLMAMAFILFGVIPSNQETANAIAK
jgi:integrase